MTAHLALASAWAVEGVRGALTKPGIVSSDSTITSKSEAYAAELWDTRSDSLRTPLLNHEPVRGRVTVAS